MKKILISEYDVESKAGLDICDGRGHFFPSANVERAANFHSL